MFNEINKEQSFSEILNQVIDNIQSGVLKSGDAFPAAQVMAERMGCFQARCSRCPSGAGVACITTSVRGGSNYISQDIEHCLIGPLSILFRLNNSGVRESQQLCGALKGAAAGSA